MTIMNEKIGKLLHEVSQWWDGSPSKFKPDTPPEIFEKDKELEKEWELEKKRQINDMFADD